LIAATAVAYLAYDDEMKKYEALADTYSGPVLDKKEEESETL